MKAQPSKIKITEIKTTFNVKKKEEEGFVRLGEHLHEDAEQHRVCNFVQLQSSRLPQYDNGWGIPYLSGKEIKKEVIKGMLKLEIPVEIGKAVEEIIYTGKSSANILKVCLP